MKCPICGNGELELVTGQQRFGGLFVRPDVLTCPTCKAQAEQRGERLRYTFIPSPYSAVIGKQLAEFTQTKKAASIGLSARRFLEQRRAIIDGSSQPCQAPFSLKKNEECVYISPKPGVLLEQRTRQNQPYWAEIEQGSIVLTTRTIYVSHRNIPLAKIQSVNLSGQHIDFARTDRKRRQRITFQSTQLAHLAALALSDLIPSALSLPQLSSKPIQQKSSPFRANLNVPVSIPLGKGRHAKLPAFLVLILGCIMLCLLYVCGSFAIVTADATLREVGVLPTYTLTPGLTPTLTQTPIPTKTPTITPSPTSTPIPTRTPTLTPSPTSTATPGPSPTPTSTCIPMPTRTPIPTKTPTPHLTSQPQPTVVPATATTVFQPPSGYLAPGVWKCPDTTAGAAYVGSDQSDKFHYPSCRWAAKIASHNRLCFASREAATNYGYAPCGTCKP